MSDVPADSRRPHVLVVGGGLSGLAAASALGMSGLKVSLLEARPRLGGRASSVVDQQTGRTIDNCQHVTMGCCTNFRHFAESLGFVDLFEVQRELYFVAPLNHAGRAKKAPAIIRFGASRLPCPGHLGPALLRMPWFNLQEKLQIATAMRALMRTGSDAEDCSFGDWLSRHGQTEKVQRQFWHLTLVSALSESLDRIGLRHARKVFVDGFLANRTGWEVAIPSAPLDEIYQSRVLDRLQKTGVDVQLQCGVKRLIMDDSRVSAVELRSGEIVAADHFILAVPHYLATSLLPDSLRTETSIQNIDRLESAAISSVHLWFDKPLTNLPHAVFVDRLSQWMFNRSSASGSDAQTSESCLQVVISASHNLEESSSEEIIRQVDAELREVWPEHSDSKRIHGRLITEHRAVFSPLSNVDELRPVQQSSIRNLQLAGDWTLTGWPSTMEGAVRSGYMAAGNIVQQLGRSESFLQPSQSMGRLSRLLIR